MAGAETQNVETRQIGLADIRIGDSLSNIATVTPVLTKANSVGALASSKVTGTNEFFEFKSGFPVNVDGTIVQSTMAQLECGFLEHKPFTFALANGVNPLADVSATVTTGPSSSTSGTISGVITPNDTGGITETWTVVFDSLDSGTIYGASEGAVHSFTDLTTVMAPDNGGNPYFSIPANFFTGTWAADETFTFMTTAFQTGTATYGDDYQGVIDLGVGSVSDFFRVEAVVSFPFGTHIMTYVFPRAQSVGTFELDFQEAGEANLGVIFKSNKASSGVVGGNAVWDSAPLGKIHFTTL